MGDAISTEVQLLTWVLIVRDEVECDVCGLIGLLHRKSGSLAYKAHIKSEDGVTSSLTIIDDSIDDAYSLIAPDSCPATIDIDGQPYVIIAIPHSTT